MKKEAAFVRATGIVRRIDDWNIIKTSQKSLKILVFADFNHDTNQHKTKGWRSAASAWERRVCSHKPIGNPRGALPRQNTAGILCAVILSKAEEANDVDGCNGQRVLSNMSRAILCGERIMRIGGRESGYVVETIPHAYSLIFCDFKMNFTLKKM